MTKLEEAARKMLEYTWMLGTDDVSVDEWEESQKAEAELKEALGIEEERND